MNNQLAFGDNLTVPRDSFADASVDLICLAPPFNSKRDYKLLFRTPKPPKAGKTGKGSIADLLAGKKPQLPDLSRGEQTFKKARKEEAKADQAKLF